MRIVQVVADGRPGGGTVVVLALLEALIERGDEVTLVTQPGSSAAASARALGADVRELDLFAFRSASRELSSALDAIAPGLVHVHGSRAAFHATGWSAGHRETPVHYTVHGYHFHHRSWMRRVLGRWAERRVGARLRSVVHVCQYDRALAEQWGLVGRGVPRRVIYNGVDAQRLPSATPSEPAHAVFVGRLVSQKDPELIAAIAGGLAAAEVKVTIVGGGEREDEVERALADEIGQGRVAMHGAVERERALTELACASVLVLPSKWEGLPIALLEALAMGVPVVAADVGGIAEVIGGDVGGYLVADREPASFVDRTRELIADPELRRRLGEAGRQRVSEHFTLETCLRQYLELYGRQ